MVQETYSDFDVLRAITSVKTTLKSVFDGGKLSLTHTKDGLVFYTSLQTFEKLRPTDPVQRVVFDTILTHAYAAEKIGPGAFNACIQELLTNSFHGSMGTHNKVQMNSLSETVMHGVHHATTVDIDWLVQTLPTKSIGSMVKEALVCAGFAGHVCIEKANSRIASVELTRGYVFDLKTVFGTNVVLDHPRVMCIDGYIETVSELHHFLHAASETREPCLLFLRGMADDVKQTLKTNYDRGTLRVVPVIVPFDLSGLNTLNDIAIVSGTDVTSSNKGQLMSNLKLSDAVIIDKAILQGNRTTLFNIASMRSVKIHLNNLRMKRFQQNVTDVSSLLDERIKSLLPNHTVIRLPDDRDFVIKSQAIDYVLRSIKALVDYGTVVIDGKKTLTITAYACAVYSQRCRETLTNLGCVVA